MNREYLGAIFVIFSFHMGTGVFIPYFPLWLQDRALDASQIAVILAVPAMLRIVGAPVFGYIGDTVGRRLVIRVMTLLVIVFALLLSQVHSFWPILILTTLIYTSWQSMPLQIDGIIIDLVRRSLVKSYGSVRAFGSSAYILANFCGTFMLTLAGSGGVILWMMGTCTLLLVATTQVSPGETDRHASASAKMPINVWLQPKLVSAITAAAMVHGAHSAFISFGALHMRDIGFSNFTMGVVFAAATGAEVVMFFFGHLITNRLSPIQWIALGATVAVFRWTATAFVDDPVGLVALQLLHGFTFSGTYLGVIGYIVKNVDPRQVASAQGIYIALFGGFNAGLTFVIGGVFDQYGGHSFILSAVLPLMALLLLGIRRLLIDRGKRAG